jgi:hypothetical protein
VLVDVPLACADVQVVVRLSRRPPLNNLRIMNHTVSLESLDYLRWDGATATNIFERLCASNIHNEYSFLTLNYDMCLCVGWGKGFYLRHLIQKKVRTSLPGNHYSLFIDELFCES